MTDPSKHGRLTAAGDTRLLFLMCWIAYVTTYLGRLNYAACLVEISVTQGWTKGEAGLIATGFFAAYGLGQLINGMIGDRLSPKIMVACGLGCSGLVNLLFPGAAYGAAMGLWCINGFVQSMIWSPLMRLLSEWLSQEKRLSACVHMNSTVPVGTLLVYGMSAALVWLGSWKTVFYVSGTILLLVTALWLITIHRLEKKAVPAAVAPMKIKGKPVERASFWPLALAGAIPLCCGALVMQGMLKDGVTTWIPTFLEEEFGLHAAAAILSTTVVPIINLGGVYLASWLNKRLFHNEMRSAAAFFLAGVLALVLLFTCAGASAGLSLLLLALTTTFMMSINTLLVSMLPSYFVRYGLCSTVSGVLNSAVYVGCALSTYLNGAVVERLGWNHVMVFWSIYAAAGMILCALSVRRWKHFRQQALAETS